MRDFLLDLSNIIVRILKVWSYELIWTCDITLAPPLTNLFDCYYLFRLIVHPVQM